MSGKIIPLQRDTASHVFITEWRYQLANIEHSLIFLEEYFLWASRQMVPPQSGPCAQDTGADTAFYNSEVPSVCEEAKDALKTLKVLCKAGEV